MPVKYWSFAGLMLTSWCNAECASCYVSCSPARREEMSADDALAFWASLVEASPHGCRVHLTGGEPFGDWPRLIEICRRASGEGLGPAEKVETNAFWATDERVVRDRLAALDAAGMGKLVISADPYHQQFVPIERCRLAARLAEEILGPRRVQVRWRDWLADGYDTDSLGDAEREALFARCALGGRDRLTGRAAERLAEQLPPKPAGEYADTPCREALLRSRHVHVDPAGRVMPGTCAGLVLGTIGPESVSDIWRRLESDHADRAIIAPLARGGPTALRGRLGGEEPLRPGGYASKCHFCWLIRRELLHRGLGGQEIQPAWMYGL